jgi:uncharacterized membrane protein
MKKIKKSLLFIGLGAINLLHAGLHIIQFIQSVFLVSMSVDHHHHHHHHHKSFLETLLHNPIFALIWGIIGILTLVIGIKDFKHHNKCDH